MFQLFHAPMPGRLCAFLSWSIGASSSEGRRDGAGAGAEADGGIGSSMTFRAHVAGPGACELPSAG
eukprot:CAMPEP_0179366404 /NCGR_PEP_ID=MMETSP0797-20121207/83047_1 /TAXON_ID=47934 /ORGANISM="Dinophysis acuminata, Strain DAEP01" /LENGTH=65 /DNA_ID=CAMNT_0021081933 /DNA_START=42 /DNA_END=236 /DNA_ORIENTATION=+